jgi:hypothetical protein
MRAPGGVDFTTLDLRYVKTTKTGLDYSFTARNTDEDTAPGFAGREKSQLISDAMFAWLALTPDKFWVNLNPDEPDRVMDATFGTTDAGRVLLQADLAMKHDYAATLKAHRTSVDLADDRPQPDARPDRRRAAEHGSRPPPGRRRTRQHRHPGAVGRRYRRGAPRRRRGAGVVAPPQAGARPLTGGRAAPEGSAQA